NELKNLGVLGRRPSDCSPRRQPWVTVFRNVQPRSGERFGLENLSPLRGSAFTQSAATPSRAWLRSDGPPGLLHPENLEHVFQRRLHDARVARPQNLPEVCAVQRGNGIVQVHEVRNVERLHAEL